MVNRSEHAHMLSQSDTHTLDAGAGNCDHFTGGVEEGLTSTSEWYSWMRTHTKHPSNVFVETVILCSKIRHL